VKAGQSAIELT